ncbi:hypothetical protein SLEP1_g43179 [Rubroshorea leprosula]|uniref:Uncharacterized protein n=1 Tax=Rubroshorea leprosula TaxID=152421 RepID=A0AAV5LCW9_9ROSI|nr:hypothetical protein SLEP1_g43179 [Rubroshorea leprosula]
MGIIRNNYGSSGLASMDGRTLPVWRSKASAPVKLGAGDAADFAKKRLDGKSMEMNLIPRTMPLDAN